MKNIINLSIQTKKVLIGISIIICISLLVAYIYYNGKNRAEDPRIVETKYMFRQFDNMMKENKFSSALPYLDSIEIIFTKIPGYKDSYEPGIVYNDRGSAYLSMALYENKDSTEKVKMLDLAEKSIDSSIVIYNTWLGKNKALSIDELFRNAEPFFFKNDPAFAGRNVKKIIHKRAADLFLAQKEAPRRLSVCYTNLGIIQRHQYKQNEAVESYIQAIKLWRDNFTARNNFNVLMGLPPKDRSIIDQLFPPDKNNYN